MDGECTTYGREKNAYGISVQKSKGKRQLRRPNIDGRILLK
jgi:hypothetical protein